MNWKQPREAIGVTGMGVFCASAHGVEGFDSALRAGVSTVTFHEPALGLPAPWGCVRESAVTQSRSSPNV